MKISEVKLVDNPTVSNIEIGGIIYTVIYNSNVYKMIIHYTEEELEAERQTLIYVHRAGEVLGYEVSHLSKRELYADIRKTYEKLQRKHFPLSDLGSSDRIMEIAHRIIINYKLKQLDL